MVGLKSLAEVFAQVPDPPPRKEHSSLQYSLAGMTYAVEIVAFSEFDSLSVPPITEGTGYESSCFRLTEKSRTLLNAVALRSAPESHTVG